jgi:hypothetical protein
MSMNFDECEECERQCAQFMCFLCEYKDICECSKIEPAKEE